MASVRIWVKKQLNIGALSFNQRRMLGLMSVGLGEVLRRVKSATGPTDQPAKPLKPGYMRRKIRQYKKWGRRDLTLTGAMLQNLSVRTVSENKGMATVTSRKEKVKAWANMRREAWLVFSPANQEAIRKLAQAELAAEFQRLPK
jgi:hypothetical protein